MAQLNTIGISDMRKTNTGHQCIVKTKNGTYLTVVNNENLGTVKTLERAIQIRDDYRVKHNMPPVRY